jgi:hypothetical protein
MKAESDQNASTGTNPLKRRAAATKEQPIRQFARFFKTYSLGLSLVVAALPFGIARWSLIPMFESNKYPLTIITSVASYLLVGYIFSQRQTIARIYFPGVRPGIESGKMLVASKDESRRSRIYSRFGPSALAVASIVLFLSYMWVVSDAIQSAAYQYSTELPQGMEQASLIQAKIEPGLSGKITPAWLPFGQGKAVQIIRKEEKVNDKVEVSQIIQFPDEDSVRAILAGVPWASIPYSTPMSLLFLGAFLCAASAFVLMGLKDYLQEVLGLSDESLILNPTVETEVIRFDVEGVAGVYGFMEYTPHDPDYPPSFDGCYCKDGIKLSPKESDPSTGKVTKWEHVWKTDKGILHADCVVTAEMSFDELDHRMRNSGWKRFHREFAHAESSKRSKSHNKPKPPKQSASQTETEKPQETQTPPIVTTQN